jgi:hypothetical protein
METCQAYLIAAGCAKSRIEPTFPVDRQFVGVLEAVSYLFTAMQVVHAHPRLLKGRPNPIQQDFDFLLQILWRLAGLRINADPPSYMSTPSLNGACTTRLGRFM